jgi:hypothetical protein
MRGLIVGHEPAEPAQQVQGIMRVLCHNPLISVAEFRMNGRINDAGR